MHKLAMLRYFVFFLMIRRPPRSTLFPYTTLFRSVASGDPLPAPLYSRHAFSDLPGNLGSATNCRAQDRKSTRLNSSHSQISYAVFCLKKKPQPRPDDPSTAPPINADLLLPQRPPI